MWEAGLSGCLPQAKEDTLEEGIVPKEETLCDYATQCHYQDRGLGGGLGQSEEGGWGIAPLSHHRRQGAYQGNIETIHGQGPI